MDLTIPELSLVCLVGASGSGKSTFARNHFLATEILSSDHLRGVVSDDETDQSATPDAFDALHFLAAKRLARGKLTVVDATNVQPASRKPLIALARKFHVMPVAIVFDIDEDLCHQRNAGRPERAFGPHVVRRQSRDLRQSLRHLEKEGFRYVFVLKSAEEMEAATIVRQRMWTDRKSDHGPFDIIGDIHGCYDELRALLLALGYEPAEGTDGFHHPLGRSAVFLGDLVDRGPATPAVLRCVMAMAAAGDAICVPGNHENKLIRHLRGRSVQLTHGLAETVEQLALEEPEFRRKVLEFLDGLVSHFVLDDGKLVVSHAGLPAEMHGRASGAVRSFALYGETTGETDEYGLPVRYNWARDYRGAATVVYGHTPVPSAEWENNTICLDTGCVFGGRLTALRYPERELVSVPAARVYYQPVKPFPSDPAVPTAASAGTDAWLQIEDVTGRRTIQTELSGNVIIGEEYAAAALEVMSRHAVDPRWLIYLPPTMSPVETAELPGLLEHPDQAFAYYRAQGLTSVICQEKHMGSRLTAVVAADAPSAAKRFGVAAEGALYTRTGRRFFDDPAVEGEILSRVRAAIESAGLWTELATDWLLLDCELMPWSAKAEPLLRNQYASVGAAAHVALAAEAQALAASAARYPELAATVESTALRAAAAEDFRAAYRRYAWETTGVEGLRLAPFHLLASENQVHTDKPHVWHLEMASRLAAADAGLLFRTPSRTVDVGSADSITEATTWWQVSTEQGMEGMVVKPADFIARGPRGLLQPALKVRGREYLRIIYGPEYTLPANLDRLRARGVGRKRALAQREFALGLEALNRFVRREPLHRVHECVFAVLALESEPVDPRL
jgi:protein phosphatase